MPRLTKPSLKQRKFVKAYVDTGNIRKAALMAYDTNEINAYNVGSAALAHPQVQTLLRKVLEEKGLTDDKISESLSKLVDAGLTPDSLAKAKPDDALKAIKEINKLKDNYPVERKQIETKSAHLNIDVKGKSPEELNSLLEELSDELLTFKRMINNTRKTGLKEPEEGTVV